MKKRTIISTIVILFLASCAQKELSREEALQLVTKQERFPKVIDYDFYRSDPQQARKAIDAGLEKEGLVTVQRTQKLGDVGKPLIGFTEKALPYLLSTSEKDKGLDVQRVKIADEDVGAITDIKTENDGKIALVEYTTIYKNLTPFSALTSIDPAKTASRKARFSSTDNGWKLEK